MKVYISLTSIFQKQNNLLKTLKSILKQTLLPDECFIYLSEEPYLIDKGFKNKKLNEELNEFLNKNTIFKVKWCKNIGPYRKLLYLLKEKWDENCLILTIDDDIEFHHNLVKDYISDYKKYKCCICYRGKTFDIKNNDFSNFNYDKPDRPILKQLFNFANSGVGTVTHPSFLHKTGNLIFDLDLITELCKTTDDIWYYFCRIANNIETIVINKPHYLRFNMTNFNNTSLFRNFNSINNNNTKNFQKTAKKFIELNLL